MENRIILGLLQNTAFLLVFSMLYDFTWSRRQQSSSVYLKLISGFAVGLLGIVLMLTPWTYVPGIVFDTRSILLSISGLFLGVIPTVVAMVVTMLYRFYAGGAGVWMGMAVIFFSGLTGILWGKFRKDWQNGLFCLELWVMGMLVHILMVGATVLLPAEMVLPTFRAISLPVLIIYPIATMLMGVLMVRQLKNRQNLKAREMLYASEYRFSEMLKNISLFSVILDASGKILFCNRYLLESTGYTADELLGRNWFDVMVPENKREKIRSVFRSLIETEKNFITFENETLTRDGSVLMVNWKNAVIRDLDGSVTTLASIGENITDLRRTEQRLKTQREEIEAQNRELMRLNQELIQARDRAEESDRLKSKFLANMSHEIRTPMNAILGFTGLLSGEGYSPEDKKVYIQYIQSAGERLMKVISDILDLSRIESNQLNIVYKYTDPYEILRQSVAMIQTGLLFREKENLRIVLDFGDEQRLHILTDPFRYQQVVDNLLSNAVKYTTEGEIRVRCAEHRENGQLMVETSVADTGQGIPEERHRLIFERFRQLDDENYREGAGLGLSICKGIVDLLGGTIGFTSEKGKGSEFTFSIPVVEAPEV
ncbi:MAG: ATP-binding protein [Bacteroidota bacterium]